jgi:hypothetical protein
VDATEAEEGGVAFEDVARVVEDVRLHEEPAEDVDHQGLRENWRPVFHHFDFINFLHHALRQMSEQNRTVDSFLTIIVGSEHSALQMSQIPLISIFRRAC